MAHVLGLITLTSTAVSGTGLAAYLWHTGTHVYTWQRRLRVPKPIKADLVLSSGSNHVGAV